MRREFSLVKPIPVESKIEGGKPHVEYEEVKMIFTRYGIGAYQSATDEVRKETGGRVQTLIRTVDGEMFLLSDTVADVDKLYGGE